MQCASALENYFNHIYCCFAFQVGCVIYTSTLYTCQYVSVIWFWRFYAFRFYYIYIWGLIVFCDVMRCVTWRVLCFWYQKCLENMASKYPTWDVPRQTILIDKFNQQNKLYSCVYTYKTQTIIFEWVPYKAFCVVANQFSFHLLSTHTRYTQ